MDTTAVGVAAGAFLFRGINSLVGSHHTSPLGGANPLSSPAADKDSPASNLPHAPTDNGSSIADSSAGFSELLNIGPDDSSDWN